MPPQSGAAPAHAACVHVCEELRAVGLQGITPEVMRRAKIDGGDAAVRDRLWAAAYAIAVALITSATSERPSAPGRSKTKKRRITPTEGVTVWEHLSEGAKRKGKCLVAALLASCEYPRLQALLALIASSSSASTAQQACEGREVLLAVGWLVGRSGLLLSHKREELLAGERGREELLTLPQAGAGRGQSSQSALKQLGGGVKDEARMALSEYRQLQLTARRLAMMERHDAPPRAAAPPSWSAPLETLRLRERMGAWGEERREREGRRRADLQHVAAQIAVTCGVSYRRA